MTSIRQLEPCAEAHLTRYLDPDHPDGPRAFHAYDGPGENPDTLSALDCLAPVLLSVRLTYADVVPMYSRTGPHRRLRAAMEAVLADPGCRDAHFLDLDLDADEGPWAWVQAAFRTSYQVPGIKTVAVSKILHRKRPALVPVYDRQLYRYYFGQFPSGRWAEPDRLWPVLQADLRQHRNWLQRLRDIHHPEHAAQLTVLRTADIIIWEHQVAPTAACAGVSSPSR